MTDLNQSLIPLCEATWELDRSEGEVINGLKATHTAPISEGIIEVPEDLKKNSELDVQEITNNYIEKVDKIFKLKQKEIMTL